MPNALLSALSKVGIALESTPGTAVPPTHYVPFKSYKSDDEYKMIADDGMRGVLAKNFGLYQGVGVAHLDYEGQFYPDMPGYFLKCILGTDTVTGTGPYVHTLGLNQTGMPPTLTVTDYQLASTRQFAYAVVEEVDIKWTSEGDVNYSTKLQSQTSTSVSTITPVYTNTPPIIGWQGAMTLNAASNINMVGGNMNLKRAIKPTYGSNNTQQFTRMNVGQLEVSGKLTFEVTDYTEQTLYLNNTQGAAVITFTQGTNTLKLQMSQLAVDKSSVDRSQEMLRIDMDYKAIYNSTDNGPCLIVLTNNVATYS